MRQLEITTDCIDSGIEYKPGATPTLPDRAAQKLVDYGRARFTDSPEAKPRQDPPQKRLRNTRGDTA